MLEFNERLVLYVASDEEFKTDSYYRRLWLAVRNLGIPRRQWPEILSMFLVELELKDIEVRWQNDELYEIPFVDDLFPDPDCRWISDFIERHESGFGPKSKSRKYEVLRILDAYIRVKHPKFARLIRK